MFEIIEIIANVAHVVAKMLAVIFMLMTAGSWKLACKAENHFEARAHRTDMMFFGMVALFIAVWVS